MPDLVSTTFREGLEELVGEEKGGAGSLLQHAIHSCNELRRTGTL